MSNAQSSSPRSQRLRELKELVRSNQGLWGWGTDEGLIPWEDRSGATMVVLWQSESRAREENEGPDAGPDEVPIRFTVTDLQQKFPEWTRKGVRRYGLEPMGKAILYSLNPDEFLMFVTTGSPADRKLP